ncbi:LysE family translocator [Streptomyces sp. 184]|uniref:LysE family translocator n=1 Tax=Streptomyces sp. 184 TaxID=1827526 RepID=UPI003891440B
MDTHLLVLFLGVDLLLIATPGPDWLYIVARGLGQGRRAALYAVAGIGTGYAAHTVLAAVGLAAALGAVPGALPALRYAGAAYLVFLAVGLLRSLRRPGGLRGAAGELAETGAGPGAATVLRQSLLTALLNPKGLLLYLALIPQFINPDAALPLGAQTAVLGLLHVVNCSLAYVLVALVSARAGSAFGKNPRAARRLSAVSAALLLATAGFTAGAH